MSALDLHVHTWSPATSEGLPTLLLLHGTGGNELDLLPLGRAMLPGAAMLGVRGNVLEHGAPRFFRRLAEGVFDLEDLRVRTEQLADFVEAAADRYGFVTSALQAVGYSNGANVAASVLLTRPSVLAGGLLFRAMMPFAPETAPSLTGKRVLLSAGRMDQMIPPAGVEQLESALRNAGADVELVWQPASHGLTQADVEVGARFLASLPH